MSTTHMANMVELSNDELLSIEGGWDWGDFAAGATYSIMIAMALTAPITPLGWALLFASGVTLFVN